MNAALIAQMIIEVTQILAGLAQTQIEAHTEGRDVTDEELATHRQAVADARANLLAHLSAGS